MPPASPKGQLPYIVDDAASIADSTFIRAHIEAKYGFDFDAGLDLRERAQAWALVALGLRALAAVEAVLQEKLTAWARNVIGRALRGARFAATADTTVAAGGVQVQALFRAIGSLA